MPLPVPGRRGFTIMEVVIAVAIVAVLAGAAAPLVHRRLQDAREDATETELATLRAGLLRFYEDTGRFPTAPEGLLALDTDPGVTGWQGPYVGGRTGADEEILEDGFDRSYHYDAAPTTSPAGAADVLVASAGRDGILTAGSVGATWTQGAAGDDQLALVTAGRVDRGKIRDCREVLRRIGDAGARRYADTGSFPAAAADLLGSYLPDDAGLFVDPWFQAVTLTVQNNGSYPPDLVLRSRGPDQTDDGGAGDDIEAVVSAIPPGRARTLERVRTAQAALAHDPILVLTGDWDGADRAALNLPVSLDTDGWGRELRINTAARLVFSAGPDGDPATQGDNVPAGAGL